MKLPTFQYHPDPISTGVIIPSDDTCCCCGKRKGFIYIGPVYAIDEYNECICPWCISNGSAHNNLDVSFTDEEAIGGYGKWDSVEDKIIEEIAYSTPGFNGWQQEQWWTHCKDAGQFLGRVGFDELAEIGSDAIDGIRVSTGIKDINKWGKIISSLNKLNGPSAYLFKCSICGKFGGYIDHS